MSGIYIKNMEIPKPKFADMVAVYDAYILVSPDGQATIVVDDEDGLNSIEYPLIPVPDHGRLGDLDALEIDILNMRARYQMLNNTQTADKIMHGLFRAEQAIKDAPIIIPVDKGDKI